MEAKIHVLSMQEGGSWEVRVSLASVGNWVRSLGRLGPNGFRNGVGLPKRMHPPEDEIAALSTELRIVKSRGHTQGDEGDASMQSESEQNGAMLALRHSAILDRTPVNVTEARVELNVDIPVWISRA
jgi:hypothetical protein